MSQVFNSPESYTISRRALLKLFGVGAATGVLGYSRFTKPKPTVFQQDTLNLPERRRESPPHARGGMISR
ncbi:twin-arginine translocation signal domain-containing protein [Scytonema sp. PRP1]|uniref:twin-arginine translocation signal domain-containing protein n=1 Tax=Scytonema sp. PRP1 TaxID=3120513 RepID=UPI003FA68464